MNSDLGERLLDGATTSEGAGTNEEDHGEHQRENDPSDPGKGHESLGRVAVGEWVSLVSAAKATASSVGQSSGTGHPENPGQEESNRVSGDRSNDASNAEEEQSGLYRENIVSEVFIYLRTVRHLLT